MSDSTARKRSRVACTSCQLRKRKCSGEQPCNTCAQSGYGCYYDFVSRKKKDTKPGIVQAANLAAKLHDSSSPTATRNWSETSPADSQTHLNSLEANSGAAFVRRLGLKVDPAHAPRLHLFAWNVGTRRSSMSGTTNETSQSAAKRQVVDIISQSEMISLATIYFEKVDPCYGFIDRDTFLQHVNKRWLDAASSPAAPSPQTTNATTTLEPYDSVLCGVAAFGYLFSRREAPTEEYLLVESARIILEQSLLSDLPSVAIVTGWVLRVAYLRMTATPHAAWMASCSLMHMVEAAGLHLEVKRLPSDSLLIQRSTDNETCDPEIRRRLFGMARHLNIWVAFDLGRSRVVLHGATALSPSPKAGDYTTDLFHLLPLSESLDPNKTQDSPDLENALSKVLDIVHAQPPLILAQCNLMLCIYRRLRAVNPNIPGKLLERLLALCAKGLRSVKELVSANSPWHQIANVPFQTICSLLAIDSRSSLAMLGDALQTLRLVASAYDTDVTREAYSTAYLLILLHQRRKEEDTRTLGQVLSMNPSASVSSPLDPPSSSGMPAPGVPSALTRTAASVDQQQQRQQRQKAESLSMSNGTGAGGAGGDEQLADPSTTTMTTSTDPSEFSWLGELMIDLPSLQNFDLEQFLSMDVPWPLPETGI